MNVRMMQWVDDELRRVDGLVLSTKLGEAVEREWLGAVVDSRSECSGRIFFAIRGENTDGHSYIQNAHSAGSAASVVERADATDLPHIVVRDSTEALQELSRAYRDHLEARVVAVTGSAGKTTTKEYIRAIMRTKYRVHCNPGNYNSLIGVPIAVLEAEEDCEYLVSEVGANETGEIDFLTRLLRPDVGVITNIGDAHVGCFGSRGAIAAAKGELLDHMGATGMVLLPRDDDYFNILKARAGCKVYSFGGDDADFVMAGLSRGDEGRLAFTVNGTPISLEAVGTYNAMNACAAYAVGELCGVEPDTIGAALAGVTPMPGRGRMHQRAGITIVDESYNASPASMALSLTMLAETAGAARRIAVLGDMKELGDETAASHESIGRHAASLPLDSVWWVGEEAEHVGRGMKGAAAEFVPLAGVADAIDLARERFTAGDAILVKASRVCQLDTFVGELLRLIDEGTVG